MYGPALRDSAGAGVTEQTTQADGGGRKRKEKDPGGRPARAEECPDYRIS